MHVWLDRPPRLQSGGSVADLEAVRSQEPREEGLDLGAGGSVGWVAVGEEAPRAVRLGPCLYPSQNLPALGLARHLLFSVPGTPFPTW